MMDCWSLGLLKIAFTDYVYHSQSVILEESSLVLGTALKLNSASHTHSPIESIRQRPTSPGVFANR